MFLLFLLFSFLLSFFLFSFIFSILFPFFLSFSLYVFNFLSLLSFFFPLCFLFQFSFLPYFLPISNISPIFRLLIPWHVPPLEWKYENPHNNKNIFQEILSIICFLFKGVDINSKSGQNQ